MGGRTYVDFVLQEIQAVADSGAALDYCLHMWKQLAASLSAVKLMAAGKHTGKKKHV